MPGQRWGIPRPYPYLPDRLLVGEVRQEEALDLWIVPGTTACRDVLTTCQLARKAIVKLCALPLLAGENVVARLHSHVNTRKPVSDCRGCERATL